MNQASSLLVSKLCAVQLEVLNTLEKNDVTGQFHCVSLQEWFEYRGHVCMAFERLGLSLYDFLRRSGYLPFQVNLVGAQRSAQRALVPVLLCAVLNISLHGAMHAWLAGLLNSAQKHRHVHVCIPIVQSDV